ncbi:AAA family protein [Phlyctema vagabunda]|uniref:AAA family protein n=1 Tax=Phlyctema vagabunda TaxID=108571 RepID=A0ABR4PIV0_9HELO
MGDTKVLHPIFTKTSKQPQNSASLDTLPRPDPATNNADNETRRHAKARGGQCAEKAEDLEVPENASPALLEVVPNDGRRKRPRRITTVSKPKDIVNVEQLVRNDLLGPSKMSDDLIQTPFGNDQTGTVQKQTKEPVFSGTNVQETMNEPIHSGHELESIGLVKRVDPSVAMTSPHSIPKKILKYNPRTGTIGPPPAKTDDISTKKEIQQPSTLPSTRPSRNRTKHQKTRIVILRYDGGPESRVGKCIDEILLGPSVKSTKQLVPTAKKGSKLTKTTHPFFVTKDPTRTPDIRESASANYNRELPKPVSSNNSKLMESSHRKISMVSGRGRPTSVSKSSSAFVGFGKTDKLFKFPGAVEPAWPWKGMLHARGEVIHRRYESSAVSNVKKSKDQAVKILVHEELLVNLARELNIPGVAQTVKEYDQDEFDVPPSCLRIPRKHFETGPSLQRRIRKQTKAFSQDCLVNVEESSEDDRIESNGLQNKRIHPALQKLYSAVATSLSPFDKSQCETQAWTIKYSPQNAAEVLQRGQETHLLKRWLQSLTVMAVETSGADISRSRATSVACKRSINSKVEASSKRKRKAKKLDDFIVSSDSEQNDMDELTDPDEVDSFGASQGLLKRTVIRAGDGVAKGSKELGRLSNAVLVSGPHGSGKTAAVYAVAKELDFEVFEINSSSRRSGKDVVEKVGDMTRNHLVQQSQNHTNDGKEDDLRQISDAFAEDLKSGRQGTMKSFFKTKDATKAGPKIQSTSIPETKDTETSHTASKTSPKQQKQSLILLEEVDIIYEEDKQFWTTILTLIAQSKRPFIITCTDESLVPLQSLQLHAIFRFSCVPKDLAVDYMVLVAANEGHAVKRQAVESLYDSRQYDLRASITELDFWCRFTVGDCKGGLDWFYPRWPPGRDVDEKGDTVRVVSEGTYESGMGWLCQDNLQARSTYLDTENDILHELWDGWKLDIEDWQETLDVPSWARGKQRGTTSLPESQSALQAYEEFSDAISASDLYSAGAYASDNNVLLDTSLPHISNKAKDDYVLGMKLLDAPLAVTYNLLGQDMSMWMTTHAKKYLLQGEALRHASNGLAGPESSQEEQALHLIRKKTTTKDTGLVRRELSLAFDPISETDKNPTWGGSSLEACCFDRTMSLIVLDVAPYVRSIVAYDMRLQQDRSRLSNLLSEGGRQGKRMRTTRSAMSALEGGSRRTTRKDRYFGTKVNPYHVLKTGGDEWQNALAAEMTALGPTEVSETSSDEQTN